VAAASSDRESKRALAGEVSDGLDVKYYNVKARHRREVSAMAAFVISANIASAAEGHKYQSLDSRQFLYRASRI